MTLLVSGVCSYTYPLLLVILVAIFTLALFAPIPQSIFAVALHAEFALVFLLLAFAAPLHSWPPKNHGHRS
jgi:hypothetical protein